MLTARQDRRDRPMETNVGPPIRAVAFSANGDYLVSGDQETVRVWRVGDEEPAATMAVGVVNCLAVSKDGRWIAAGRWLGDVVVWDAETYEKVITLGDDYVNGVDFSPDSTRLASASDNRTVTIWDIATGKPVFAPLPHRDYVRAVKFSPQGDRIATATHECVRVFHSTGTLLVDVPRKVTPWYNTGLLWSKNQLFIISDGKIEQIDASTGSTVSEWLVPDTNSSSCIALPQHKEFIAYSTNNIITFWDTSKHTQLGLIRHPQDIRSMTLSPDDQFIAIGAGCRKITIRRLSRTMFGQECSTLIEIEGSDKVWAVTFAEDGKYLVSGGENGVRVWRVEDGEGMARMEAPYVLCVAASKDGRWIAAGTLRGEVIVWDPETYEVVIALKEDGDINGVDFSPDSTRLVTASYNGRASVWDIATHQRVVGPLPHERAVRAAKFLPQGDRIATVTQESVRVYDSNNGRLLVDIKVNVTPWFSTASLLWLNDHLFVLSDNEVKQIEASTGSTVSKWPVPNSSPFSCIALPQHGEFVAHSTNRTVVFWDTSTHTELALIQHPQDIHSIALSPDDQFLAIGGEGGKITIQQLSRAIVSIVFHWIRAYLNKILLRSLVSAAPHFPTTRHSNHRPCARFMEG